MLPKTNSNRLSPPRQRVRQDGGEVGAAGAIALLGRLAVDQAFRGQGLGAILLSDACQKVVSASRALAVAAIVVDAKDAPAAEF